MIATLAPRWTATVDGKAGRRITAIRPQSGINATRFGGLFIVSFHPDERFDDADHIATAFGDQIEVSA